MFCVVFSHDGNDDVHGVRQADTARAHARWRHLVASHEATDTLHRSMCLAPYLPSGMVVEIAVESATLYFIVYNRVANKSINSLKVNGFNQNAYTTPPPDPFGRGLARTIGRIHRSHAE